MGSIMNYNQDTIDIFTNLKVITEKHPGRLLDVLNCFNKNQYKCKKWLVDCLNNYEYHFKNKTKDSIDIAVLGGWYGLTAKLLKNYFAVKQIRNIYSYDFDPYTKKLGRMFFNDIEFVEMDIKDLEIAEKSFSIIINTSCEHMDNNWFETAGSDQLIVMQTNNKEEFDGHVNVCYTIEEMQEKYPLTKVLYIGSLETPAYTRYMQIGFK